MNANHQAHKQERSPQVEGLYLIIRNTSFFFWKIRLYQRRFAQSWMISSTIASNCPKMLSFSTMSQFDELSCEKRRCGIPFRRREVEARGDLYRTIIVSSVKIAETCLRCRCLSRQMCSTDLSSLTCFDYARITSGPNGPQQARLREDLCAA